MAYHLSAWVQCADQSQAEILETFLARNTRPVFVEDVEEGDQTLYRLIDEIEFPEEIEVQDDCLWLFWYEIEDFGFNELKVLLNKLGVVALLIFEVPDSPMSGDSDEDESSGWFWIYEQGEYLRAKRADVVVRFQNDIIERFPEWAGE